MRHVGARRALEWPAQGPPPEHGKRKGWLMPTPHEEEKKLWAALVRVADEQRYPYETAIVQWSAAAVNVAVAFACVFRYVVLGHRGLFEWFVPILGGQAVVFALGGLSSWREVRAKRQHERRVKLGLCLCCGYEGVRGEAALRAGRAQSEVGLAEQGDGHGPGVPAGGGGGAEEGGGGGRGGGGDGGEKVWDEVGQIAVLSPAASARTGGCGGAYPSVPMLPQQPFHRLRVHSVVSGP
jgi:hypothetical protein